MAYLSVNQVAEILSVHRDTAEAIIMRLPHVDISTTPKRRALRVKQEDIERWIQSITQQPKEKRKPGRKAKTAKSDLIPYRRTQMKEA